VSVDADRVLEELGRRLPEGWVLTSIHLGDGTLDITDGRSRQHLVVDEELREGLLSWAEGRDLWPNEPDRVEKASRLLSIHLWESLDTRSTGVSRSWVYRDGLFWPDPEPHQRAT